MRKYSKALAASREAGGAVIFLLDLEDFEYYFQFVGHRVRATAVIVCFCKTASTRDIASAIADGAHTVDQIGDHCGAGTGCGSCREFIAEMIDAAGASCSGDCAECPGRAGKARESRIAHPSHQAA